MGTSYAMNFWQLALCHPPRSHQVTSLCHPNEIERRQHHPINLNFLSVLKVYIQAQPTQKSETHMIIIQSLTSPTWAMEQGAGVCGLGKTGDEILPNYVVNTDLYLETHQYFMESLSIGPVSFLWNKTSKNSLREPSKHTNLAGFEIPCAWLSFGQRTEAYIPMCWEASVETGFPKKSNFRVKGT